LFELSLLLLLPGSGGSWGRGWSVGELLGFAEMTSVEVAEGYDVVGLPVGRLQDAEFAGGEELEILRVLGWGEDLGLEEGAAGPDHCQGKQACEQSCA
jgi:hypothetical protein